jgi:hypothetical protein
MADGKMHVDASGISCEKMLLYDMLELADAAIAFRDNFVTNYRKVLVLQELNRFNVIPHLLNS